MGVIQQKLKETHTLLNYWVGGYIKIIHNKNGDISKEISKIILDYFDIRNNKVILKI